MEGERQIHREREMSLGTGRGGIQISPEVKVPEIHILG